MRSTESRGLAMVGFGALIVTWVAVFGVESAPPPADQAQFTKDNRLIRPEDYREWIYLSSGLGMEYGIARSEPGQFTNVFVAPSAYRQFLATGRWPNKTMFVLEERTASSSGSINKSGHYQTGLAGLSASVKDENRFPEKWAYFSFGTDGQSAEAFPKPMCWDCHHAHGAVENTFVQFYPTLKPVALKFGTYSATKAENETAGKKK
jgi:cytochrome P460